MTYLLNDLIGRKVRDREDVVLGRLTDLLIETDDKSAHPRIVAMAYTPDRGPDVQLFRWMGSEDLSDDNVLLQKNDVRPYSLTGDEIYLGRDILDKPVIDTKAKQTVRVNDIVLDKVGGNFCVTNVIASGNVILQGLGLEDIAERLITFFRGPLPKRIVTWDDLNFLSRSGVPVEQPRETLEEMHPADIAEIVENVGPNIGVQILKPLEDEKIADTLEEMEPDLQSRVLDAFSEERAADIVEEMEPDEAADMLQEFDEKRRARVIDLMEPEERADVTELLEYHPDTAGGWMTTKYAWVHRVSTVGEALQELRQAEAKDEVEMKYYVY
ncbi:MAG TPA: hypothetical protein VMC62_12570, partial [Longilinea sp.]|nr:hypothetical protein [Longilinea sp.]